MQADDPSSDLAELYRAHLEIQRHSTDRALEKSGFEAMAIFAGRQRTGFLDDQPYPFKINPHFKLWTPVPAAEDCWILYRPGHPLTLLFVQKIDYWYKAAEVPSGFWTQHFQIEVIRDPLHAKGHICRIRNCAFIGEWRPEFEAWGFSDRNPPTLLSHLHYLRATKSAYELECMRRASRLAAHAHRASESAFRAGVSEYDIQMSYLSALRQTESELPYPNIVALNGNAAVLHYQNLDRAAPSQLYSLLIDAGAQSDGYAADVTRTHSYRDDDFACLIRAMDDLQRQICAQVRAGVDYTRIHLSAYLLMGTLLEEFELITVSAADAAATELTSVFFPHGIGHLLGLQVHDVGGLAADASGGTTLPPRGHPHLRTTRRLEPGFVVTIEPGLYFIDELLGKARTSPHAGHVNWLQVDRFRRYGGIRIEDNVVCTAGDPENLTRAAFDALEQEPCRAR